MELQLAERKLQLQPPGKEKQCQSLYIYLQGKKEHPRAMNVLLTLGLPILPHLKKITRFTQINELSCWKRKSASFLVFKILSFILKDSRKRVRLKMRMIA